MERVERAQVGRATALGLSADIWSDLQQPDCGETVRGELRRLAAKAERRAMAFHGDDLAGADPVSGIHPTGAAKRWRDRCGLSRRTAWAASPDSIVASS